MARITVFENVTLDGVMQAPGRPDEDDRGGFTHAGWGAGYQDEVMMRAAREGMAAGGGLLFGRWTYQDLLAAWTGTTEPNPFTQVLLDRPKYVVSRRSTTTLPYPNSTLLVGDAAQTVARLREESETDLTVLGSGELVRSLHAAGLVDEFVLQVHPIVMGSGTTLFGVVDRVDLTLVESVATTTGVLINRYRPAG